MRQKTAIVTGLLILAMICLVTIVIQNEAVLRQDFVLLGTRMSTATAMGLALLSGFAAFGLWAIGSGVARALRRFMRQLRKNSERDAEEKYLKGLDASLGDRPLEAINHFRRALEAQPDYLPALLKLGEALRQTGRADEAIEVHARAQAGHPSDLPLLYALVDDYLATSDHERAKQALAKILRIQPKRALHAYRILRELYIKEGNWKKAMEAQERITELRIMEEERASDAPYTPGILYQQGADLLQQEKRGDAIAQLEKVRHKHPAFIPTYIKLAEAYLLEGQDEKATATYLEGFRRAGSTTCLLAMEKMFLDKGTPEEAIAAYQGAVASTDRKLVPKFLLAILYYRLEVMDKAEQLLREIDGSVRQSGLVQYYLGRIRERRGDFAQACARYREVIRILRPFEMVYVCKGCHEKSPEWKDFCPKCLLWGTWVPDFKDELMQELPESSPVFYQEISWDKTASAR
ncbi:MAG: tetratricopeptide repeat protein [Acidobacteria bacterium]|jgi:tetratricopeptide (TPR) repeat protein|nr:tetratricopeptide repeat protein [Acidobacteriota bacterium]